MSDRQEVIRGLQAIYDEAYDRWVHTQYGGDRLVALVSDVVPDTLALLREQEPVKRHPRVMTLEEVQDALDTVVWLDDGGENTSGNYALVESYSGTMTAVWFKLMDREAGQQRRHYESYGKRWRCWDIRPTDEQRRAVKWDA